MTEGIPEVGDSFPDSPSLYIRDPEEMHISLSLFHWPFSCTAIRQADWGVSFRDGWNIFDYMKFC